MAIANNPCKTKSIFVAKNRYLTRYGSSFVGGGTHIPRSRVTIISEMGAAATHETPSARHDRTLTIIVALVKTDDEVSLRWSSLSFWQNQLKTLALFESVVVQQPVSDNFTPTGSGIDYESIMIGWTA